MESIRAKIEELKPALVLFYLSLTGCVCMFSVQSYLGLEFAFMPCFCFMAIIFGVYTFNRFTDLTEDFTTDIERVLYFQRKRGFLALAIGSMIGSAVLLVALGKLNWLHCLLLGTGFAYSYRMIPWYNRAGGWRFIRIKEMIFVKNLAVAFLWSASIFLLPILYSPSAIGEPRMLALLGGGLFLAVLNNTLFDDILDEPGDRIAGISTLPTMLGPRNSFLFLVSLDVAWILGSAYLAVAGIIDAWQMALLVWLAGYPILYMGLTLGGKLSKVWRDFVAESDLLFFAIGLALLGLR